MAVHTGRDAKITAIVDGREYELGAATTGPIPDLDISTAEFAKRWEALPTWTVTINGMWEPEPLPASFIVTVDVLSRDGKRGAMRRGDSFFLIEVDPPVMLDAPDDLIRTLVNHRFSDDALEAYEWLLGA